MPCRFSWLYYWLTDILNLTLRKGQVEAQDCHWMHRQLTGICECFHHLRLSGTDFSIFWTCGVVGCSPSLCPLFPLLESGELKFVCPHWPGARTGQLGRFLVTQPLRFWPNPTLGASYKLNPVQWSLPLKWSLFSLSLALFLPSIIGRLGFNV